MSSFLSPEAQGRRHKLRVLDGYAAVVLAVLLLVAVADVPIDPPQLAIVIVAVSRAVFGVVDRMPRWKGERQPGRPPSTSAGQARR